MSENDHAADKEERDREDRTAGGAEERWRIATRLPLLSPAEVEQRFEELIRARWASGPGEPRADVFVLDREIWVELDLPGVREDAVGARLEHGTLVVEATRHFAPPEERARAARLERPRGPLRRRVPLPTVPRTARLEIRLEHGVLRIRIRPEAEQT